MTFSPPNFGYHAPTPRQVLDLRGPIPRVRGYHLIGIAGGNHTVLGITSGCIDSGITGKLTEVGANAVGHVIAYPDRLAVIERAGSLFHRSDL